MPGDSPILLPPCGDQDPHDSPHPNDVSKTPESLVHECYDPHDLHKVEIPPRPDLATPADDWALKLLTHEILPKSDFPSLPPEVQAMDAAKDKVLTEAWQDFFTNGKFPTPTQARDAFFTLMHGYGFEIPKATLPIGKLTGEQLQYVNWVGENHSADNGIYTEKNPNFKWMYTPQHN